MVNKLDEKTLWSEFISHRAPHLYYLVQHLCKKLCNVLFYTWVQLAGRPQAVRSSPTFTNSADLSQPNINLNNINIFKKST